ncbi:MAG: leucine-rich repeat domain-containing protein, partial [Eubacterium sp.]|nr:leucine-rich repeat domain-containing protein [Eubacterium sp.]
GNKVDRVADAQILAFSREFGIKALDDHIETTINSIRYFVYNNEKTARIIEGFDNLKGNIKIPENVTINGKTYKVTIIDANAFSNINAITSVELPDTIKSIRANAFSNTGIKEMRIPDSVEEIDTYAFGYTGERNEKTGEIIINKVPGFLIYANSKNIASQYAYDNGFTLVSEKVAAKIKVKAKAKRKKNRRVYLKWKTKKYADGYQIYKSKTKKGKYKKVKTLNSKTANNWTSKKIKKKTKKVFYKVRSFTLIGGKKVYGKWSKVVRVKFK